MLSATKSAEPSGRKVAQTHFMIRWQQVRPAGTTDFGEICDTRETAQDFIVGWLWGCSRADGSVFVDRQQGDAAGKWPTLETEEVSQKT